MRVFAAILILISLGTGCTKKGADPDQVENTAWDPKKPPIVEEPEIQATRSEKKWKEESAALSAQCKAKGGLETTAPSRLEGSGIKEKEVEVRGDFTRIKVCLVPDLTKGQATGQGWIDLSSWDSGLPARDRRVVRFVFGVEQEGSVTGVPFTFEVAPWRLELPPTKPGDPAPVDSWEAQAKAQVDFKGKKLELVSPVRVERDGKVVRLKAEKPIRVDFFSDVLAKGFHEMMARCNHHFLAKYAHSRFEWSFQRP